MPVPTAVIDTTEARACLMAAARRNAELIESLDLELPVPGLEWTVGDTAAHLIFALRGFTSSARADYAEWYQMEDKFPATRTPDRIEAVNRYLLAVEPRHDASTSAQRLIDGASAFLAASAGLHPDQSIPTPWYGDAETLTVAEATCLLLGEQVIHGYDMAKVTGQKRTITKHEALLIFQAVRTMFAKIADPTTIDDVSATYELRLGRSTRFVVRIGEGGATTEAVAGQRIDCHILAEPVAMLLLAYGRISQWEAIGRFKMITWGTKPWIAFRLKSFFSNP